MRTYIATFLTCVLDCVPRRYVVPIHHMQRSQDNIPKCVFTSLSGHLTLQEIFPVGTIMTIVLLSCFMPIMSLVVVECCVCEKNHPHHCDIILSLCPHAEERGKGKGPVESEGFINALSSQAAKMKEKKRKVSKVKSLTPSLLSTYVQTFALSIRI